MTARADTTARRGHSWLRALSLATAGFGSLALMLDPYLLSGISSARLHDALPLTMFGTTGLFVYGFGFEPKTKLLRIVFHPVTAWALFIVGAAALVSGM